MYTELIQTFLIIGGSVIVTIIGLQEIGGWSAFEASVAPQALSLWRPISDPQFPWTGLIFGTTVLGIWYWCTDQFIVQRTLAARSIDQARKGAIFAALLKQLPLFIFVLPGLLAYALHSRGVIHYDYPDQSLPALIGAVLPVGLKGLVVAGFLASLMSSLSAVFNSCSTIVTMDLYRRWSPNASDHRLLRVGQIATAIMVILSLAWIPYIRLLSSSLYTYIQSVQSYIAPPIAAVFLIGILWPRANAKGAMAALLISSVVGAGRLILEMNKPSLSGIWLSFAGMNFLHFALLLFLASTAILVAVSRLTEPPPAEKTANLVLSRGRFAPAQGTSLLTPQLRSNLVLSAAVVLLVAGIWIYFS
jgi:SSS family solute:Na+ symporter